MYVREGVSVYWLEDTLEPGPVTFDLAHILSGGGREGGGGGQLSPNT